MATNNNAKFSIGEIVKHRHQYNYDDCPQNKIFYHVIHSLLQSKRDRLNFDFTNPGTGGQPQTFRGFPCVRLVASHRLPDQS